MYCLIVEKLVEASFSSGLYHCELNLAVGIYDLQLTDGETRSNVMFVEVRDRPQLTVEPPVLTRESQEVRVSVDGYEDIARDFVCSVDGSLMNS
jgi:hypothetical protein